MSTPLLGCVADDLTGATDVGGALVASGMRVVELIGPPGRESPKLPPADAVVVALKSRSIDAQDAVQQSIAAARWLVERGCQRIVFKYCSTFDSSDAGNIGPVTEALLDELRLDIAVVAPAFPRNGRSVYRGHLFVGDELLSESPMRLHPVTPMRDSNVVRLMSRQSVGDVALIAYPIVSEGPASIAAALASLRRSDVRHVVVDAVEQPHLDSLAEAVDDTMLVTGGSAVITSLAAAARRSGRFVPAGGGIATDRVIGATAILAGSCSPATLAQIAHVQPMLPWFKVEPTAIAAGTDIVQAVLRWAEPLMRAGPILIFSSASPEEVIKARDVLGHSSSEVIERILAEIGRALHLAGVRRYVIAGGETAGAVIGSLGVRSLMVGPEIEPGVPLVRSIGDPAVALVLKSGNFGSPEFFQKALEAFEIAA